MLSLLANSTYLLTTLLLIIASSQRPSFAFASKSHSCSRIHAFFRRRRFRSSTLLPTGRRQSSCEMHSLASCCLFRSGGSTPLSRQAHRQEQLNTSTNQPRLRSSTIALHVKAIVRYLGIVNFSKRKPEPCRKEIGTIRYCKRATSLWQASKCMAQFMQ